MIHALIFKGKQQSLVTLLTNISVLVLAPIIVGIFIQSYFFSTSIIDQEVKRATKQTSALIHNIFDSHLAAIQIHHDSNAKNPAIRRFFETENTEKLDYFFLSVDQSDPSHTPEFRFITDYQGLIWEDGNANFYGVTRQLIKYTADKIQFSNTWYYSNLLTKVGPRHMLLRRLPVMKEGSGEVLGFLHIAVVLDNNFSLVEKLKSESNVDNVILMANNKSLASTLHDDVPYTTEQVLNRDKSFQGEIDDLLLIETMIKVNSAETELYLVSLQDNTAVTRLKIQHLLTMISSILGTLFLFLFVRGWVTAKTENALDSLMSYTKSGSKDGFEKFEGSDIKEFHHVGSTLDNTFKELESQKKSFQDLFNFTLSPMMLWSEEGRLLQLNPAASKELNVDGIHSEDLMGELFYEFNEKLSPHLKMTAQGATLTGINVPIGEKVFRWNLSPIRVEGDISGIIVQGQDITTLINAEQQSNLARREAEKSAAARADFLAKMSHEIRTPINGILGVGQLLGHTVVTDEQKQQVDVLCQSGEHLLAVLNDILDFSKIEQGKFQIQKSTFMFKDSLNTLENIYRPACQEKDVELLVENQLPSESMIYTDQVRLNQILFNLVSNAVKFTPTGTIRVSSWLEQFSDNEESALIVQVQDTGIGIADSKLEQIFEPFVQEEATTTREYGGSGLGLTIVKNLTEMLDGEITVQSHKGYGATFTLTIPVVQKRKIHGRIEQLSHINPAELFTEKLKVLMVEDNHTNAFILRAFCQKYNMQVEWAKDGLEAMERLQLETFDLIFMDNQLPHLGGIETTREIRQNMKLGTPIYACTADTLEETRDAFFDAGANFILLKPIKEKALKEALVDFKKRFLQQS